jgi:4'-phosphopantetheinyl transferase
LAVIWSTAELRALGAIRVDPLEVIYAFVSLGGEPSAVDESLLDEGEHRRSRRFVHSTDRQRFVLAHAALRLFLARCLGIDPTRVLYENGAHGKPQLLPGLPPLEFNLSHSDEVALVAATRDGSVGVDIERMREVRDLLSIADSHFSAAERDALRSVPEVDRRPAFFRCWTRKEALIKASGEGLALDLDSFDVDLRPGSTSALQRFAGRSGVETEFSLRDLPSPPGYAAAGAIARVRIPVRWQELG